MKKTYLFFTLLFLLPLVQVKAQTGNCSPPSARTHLNINNVDALLLNGGDMWWDLISTAQYVVPKGGGVSSLFAGALWIGGLDPGGKLHMAAATYRQNGNDYFPGPLNNNGTASDTSCQQFDHMWTVYKSTIDSFKSLFTSSGQVIPQAQVPPSLLNWPAIGNPFNLIVGNRNLAPFVDVDADGIYDPTKGDYPQILGDQAVWWVINDMGNKHTETGGLPLNIEVHVMAYAYISPWNCLNDATFYQYTLYYYGATPLDSTYIGFWTDAALGCDIDDYIGCDSTRNMGIVYNGEANDPPCPTGYGNQPPFLGIDLLGGTGFPSNEPFKMSKFGYYNNDFTPMGNPQSAIGYYSYLKGIWQDNTYWTEGGNAHGGTVKTNYVYPSGPNLPLPAWSLCSDNEIFGDKRTIMSSGPHTLNPGDVRTFTIGVTWVQPPIGTYPCPSFALLNEADDCMQQMFDSNFVAAGVHNIPPVSNEEASISPNPAIDKITITFANGQPKQVMLYNLLGVEIMTYTDIKNNTLTINRNHLPAGVYFYCVKYNNNEMKSGKLIFE